MKIKFTYVIKKHTKEGKQMVIFAQDVSSENWVEYGQQPRFCIELCGCLHGRDESVWAKEVRRDRKRGSFIWVIASLLYKLVCWGQKERTIIHILLSVCNVFRGVAALQKRPR